MQRGNPQRKPGQHPPMSGVRVCALTAIGPMNARPVAARSRAQHGVALGGGAQKAELLRRKHKQLSGGGQGLRYVLTRLHVEQRYQSIGGRRIAVFEDIAELVELLGTQREHTLQTRESARLLDGGRGFPGLHGRRLDW